MFYICKYTAVFYFLSRRAQRYFIKCNVFFFVIRTKTCSAYSYNVAFNACFNWRVSYLTFIGDIFCAQVKQFLHNDSLIVRHNIYIRSKVMPGQDHKQILTTHSGYVFDSFLNHTLAIFCNKKTLFLRRIHAARMNNESTAHCAHDNYERCMYQRPRTAKVRSRLNVSMLERACAVSPGTAHQSVVGPPSATAPLAPGGRGWTLLACVV